MLHQLHWSPALEVHTSHLICTNPSIRTERNNTVPSPYLEHRHGFMAFYGILATRIDHHQLSVPCDLEIMHKRTKEKKSENKHVMHCTCAKPLSFLCHVCQFCYIPPFFLHVCSPNCTYREGFTKISHCDHWEVTTSLESKLLPLK